MYITKYIPLPLLSLIIENNVERYDMNCDFSYNFWKHHQLLKIAVMIWATYYKVLLPLQSSMQKGIQSIRPKPLWMTINFEVIRH